MAVSGFTQSNSFKYDGLSFNGLSLEMKRDALSQILSSKTNWVLACDSISNNPVILKAAPNTSSRFVYVSSGPKGKHTNIVNFTAVNLDFFGDKVFRITVTNTAYPSHQIDTQVKPWLTASVDLLTRKYGESRVIMKEPIGLLTHPDFRGTNKVLYAKSISKQTVTLELVYDKPKDGIYSGKIVFTDTELEMKMLKLN